MSRSGEPRRLPVIVAIALLLPVGVLLDRLEYFEEERQALQRKYAPVSSFPGNRTVRFLSGLGALHPQPASRADALDRAAVPDLAGRGGAVAFYGVERVPARRLPSSRRVSRRESRSSPAVMSLYLTRNDIGRILRHPWARGRAAERSAFVSFYRGTLRFAGAAGLRIHGGRSRVGSDFKSYRLYFRTLYGQSGVAAASLFDSARGPVRRLVLHNDLRHDLDGRAWRFVNPLAYDIARRAGALAPRTQPATLYINGVEQGVYVLTEYVDDEYLRAYYGHGQFRLVRTKDVFFRPPADPAYRELRTWVGKPGLDLAAARTRVDIDNLRHWFVSMLLCGTTDIFQGPALLDRRDPEARWFWINWDMDHSFMRAAPGWEGEAWEQDLFDQINLINEPRAILLRKLIREPGFRDDLAALVNEVMNHRVTPQFLAERLAHYTEQAEAFGLEDRGFLRPLAEFLERRPPALRAEVRRHLGTGPSLPVVVEVGPRLESGLDVDGYRKTADYRGWYYSGETLRVALAEQDRVHLSHWLVNGEKLPAAGGELELTVDRPTTVEPVFAAPG